MKEKIKTRIVAVIFVSMLIGMFVGGYRLGVDRMSKKIIPANAKENITVCTRVVSGDTIIISGGERVRLLGIDIKTIQTLNKQASNYVKKMLEGEQIRLEFDPNNKYINHKDKYGRLLAYVYVKTGENGVGGCIPASSENWIYREFEDGEYLFFNATMVSSGYARAYTKSPFKYMNEFRRYEREARENHRGLWAGEDFQ